MKKLLIISIFLCIQHCFAQERELDAFKYAFMKERAFPIKALNDYYINIMEYSMSSPKSKLKYGFLYPNGKVFKSAEFDYASEFMNGKSNIRKDSIFGLLFRDGSVKYFPKYNVTYFTNGSIGLAIKDKKYGFINLNGDIIIPLEYDDAFPFYDGYASVKKDDKWIYINESGENVLPENYVVGYQPIIDHQAMVYNDKIRSSKKINPLLSTMVEYMNKVSKPNYYQSLYNLKTKSLMEFSDYDEISGFYQGKYMVVIKNGKYALVNKKNQLIIPAEYDEIREINNGLVIAKKEKWGIVNLKNKIIVPFEYDDLSGFYEGIAHADVAKKSFYINKENQRLINLELDFNWFGNFKQGVALVKKNDKFGYIDKKGNILIPFIYDDALPFIKDIALVYLKKGNQCFFINKKGSKVFEEEYPYLWTENEGLIKFAQ